MADLQRVVVIGVTGAGKTTFARDLAFRLGYPHIEMDAIYWLPNWVERPVEDFREKISTALLGDQWTTDGNYSKVRDIVWGRADTVVWLDYPLWLILWRLLRRTLTRILRQEELWNGNRETFRNHMSRDSLFVWALKTYHRRRREYPLLFQQSEYAHLTIVRLHSPRSAQAWLDQV
jgi:adenylate kinase family enzyme